MLNRVILMGRLTADPELRKTASDLSVTSFTVTTARTVTDFINGMARGSSSADIFPKAD